MGMAVRMNVAAFKEGLRAKVDKPFETELIKTVRGAGYRIDG